MTGPEAYCRARLAGMPAGEAAAEAGYAGDPPEGARSLWDKCALLLEDMSVSEADLLQGMERNQQRIDRLKAQMKADREWLRALRIVRQ